MNFCYILSTLYVMLEILVSVDNRTHVFTKHNITDFWSTTKPLGQRDIFIVLAESPTFDSIHKILWLNNYFLTITPNLLKIVFVIAFILNNLYYPHQKPKPAILKFNSKKPPKQPVVSKISPWKWFDYLILDNGLTQIQWNSSEKIEENTQSLPLRE